MDRLIHDLEQAGEAWADANAAAEALEESRKSVFGSVFLGQPFGDSVALREHKTAASDEYRRHLDAMVKARQAANKARVKYDVRKVEIELIRSRIATERVAMGMR